MRGLALCLLIGCAHATAPAPAGDPLAAISANDLFARGERYREAGDFVRAEQYVAAALERGYPEPEATSALIRICVEGSHLAAALRHARAHLVRHPDDWAMRYLVASLLHALDDDLAARSELERVVAQKPAEAKPRFLLAVVLDHLGQAPAAEAELRRYLALAPSGEHAFEASARLHAHPVGR
jgi:predicted Zn-dependent protease